jgi:hypothetical protein
MHGRINHQCYEDTQDSVSPVPSLGALPFPTRETSLSNRYLKPAVTLYLLSHSTLWLLSLLRAIFTYYMHVLACYNLC